ncbi:hypothetical protein GD627_14950 [Arthrobacter yangruifuii]|uniref:DUF3533 domain-containing protein n=1 Tax=Arthrobacter yangruifuii TaxID=2606616 RepID=A0A5N6MEK4_9MICC|nr:hypothetical protein [Arthrobacter yangruifuii]KAD3456005.1 hypothetical protein GD627_14950 [Arthrobacter yangruifuii]
MSSPESTTPAPRLAGGRLVGMLGSQVMVGAAVAAAFVGLYVGLQRDPQPDHLPIAVVGTEMAEGASHAWGERVTVLQAADTAAATQLLQDHAAVAALVPDPGAPGLDLLTAGANGRSAVGAATALAAGLAEAVKQPILSTTDVVPLAAQDMQGLSGFYLVFGVTLASFILAQIMYSVAALVRLRWRVLTLVVGAAAIAAVAAILAGPVYGAVPAPVAAVIPVLTLLGIGVSLATLAIASLVGPLGNIVSTITFTTLGNASSGATVSAFLMPAAIAHIGAALPPGAAFRAISDASYFGGRDALGPVLVLLAWIVAAGGLIALHAVRSRTVSPGTVPSTRRLPGRRRAGGTARAAALQR